MALMSYFIFRFPLQFIISLNPRPVVLGRTIWHRTQKPLCLRLALRTCVILWWIFWRLYAPYVGLKHITKLLQSVGKLNARPSINEYFSVTSCGLLGIYPDDISVILVNSGRVIFLICCVAKQFLIFVINENNVGRWLPQLLPFTGQLSALIAIFQYWILISGSFFSRKWSALVFKTKCRFLRLKIILLLVKFYIKKSLCPSVFFVIANEVCRRFFFAFLFKCEQVFSVPALPLISVGDNDGASVRLQLKWSV